MEVQSIERWFRICPKQLSRTIILSWRMSSCFQSTQLFPSFGNECIAAINTIIANYLRRTINYTNDQDMAKRCRQDGGMQS